jgi:hypothetical protein
MSWIALLRFLEGLGPNVSSRTASSKRQSHSTKYIMLLKLHVSIASGAPSRLLKGCFVGLALDMASQPVIYFRDALDD